MAPAGEAPFPNLLLDPEYWQPRLDLLAQQPRHLVTVARPECSRPGVEVLELRLRAHDGEPLRALLARPSFVQEGESIYLRPTTILESGELDWGVVDKGGTQVIFRYPGERRLEDRVLDVLRVTQAACALECIECSRVSYTRNGEECEDRSTDELVIAGLIRQKGWI